MGKFQTLASKLFRQLSLPIIRVLLQYSSCDLGPSYAWPLIGLPVPRSKRHTPLAINHDWCTDALLHDLLWLHLESLQILHHLFRYIQSTRINITSTEKVDLPQNFDVNEHKGVTRVPLTAPEN